MLIITFVYLFNFASCAQIMLGESDLKDLGLPMGPRKKLQGLLREEQNKKVTL